LWRETKVSIKREDWEEGAKSTVQGERKRRLLAVRKVRGEDSICGTRPSEKSAGKKDRVKFD